MSAAELFLLHLDPLQPGAPEVNVRNVALRKQEAVEPCLLQDGAFQMRTADDGVLKIGLR